MLCCVVVCFAVLCYVLGVILWCVVVMSRFVVYSVVLCLVVLSRVELCLSLFSRKTSLRFVLRFVVHCLF